MLAKKAEFLFSGVCNVDILPVHVPFSVLRPNGRPT